MFSPTAMRCFAVSALLCSTALCASAIDDLPDTLGIPTRAVVVTGNHQAPGTPEMIGVFYSREGTYFSDPGAPRFLFLDKEGKIALGIGGQVRGTLQYDFMGSIDQGTNFITYDIPLPANPAQRQAFYADASHSSLFLKMIGKAGRFGYFQAYIRTNFTGNGPGGYGFKLKQAYLSLGGVTAGLTNSVFCDPNAAPPTIDTQGPSGNVCAQNVLLMYNPKFKNGWSAAISVEMPTVNYDPIQGRDMNIKQRVPDIPAYVQYSWDGGQSHVRASAILRNMYYRNLVNQENSHVTGWGVQLTTIAALPANFSLFGQMAYGNGIAYYFNDLSGMGFDLVPTDDNARTGKMKAPAMMGMDVGLQYNFCRRFMVSGAYSLMRLYNQHHMGSDTYKLANYWVANLYCNIIDDLQIGLEYLHGNRRDISGQSAGANRVMALLQFQF